MRYPSVRRRVVVCAAVAAGAFPLFSLPVRACPAPPTFADSILGSSVIVIGKVVAVEQRVVELGDGEAYSFPVGTLRVETVLKGDVAPMSEIEVSHVSHDAGPSVSGPDGRRLIVFARPWADAGVFSPEMTREVDEPAVCEAFTSRVREMLEIAEDSDEERNRRRTVEWALRCVEDPATRDEGVLDLARAAWVYDEERDEGRFELEASHRERLLAVVLGIADFSDWSSFRLASLVVEGRDHRLLGHLQLALAATADEPGPATRNLLRLTASLLDWRTGAYLAGRYDEDASVEGRREAVARFLRMMERLEELAEAVEPDGGTFAEAEEEAIAEFEEYATVEEPEIEEPEFDQPEIEEPELDEDANDPE